MLPPQSCIQASGEIARSSSAEQLANAPIYFIADLHLQASTPDLTNQFVRFVERITGHAQALYVLGDFFEVWLGDNDRSPFNSHIISVLKKASAGLRIYWMHGNRDFLVGHRFMAACGVVPLNDPTVVNLGGHTALLMHGDLLCSLDKTYQQWRKFTRSRLFMALVKLLPLSLKRPIARYIRKKSKQHTHTAHTAIMDVEKNEVLRIMQQYQASLLIHGHTHRPAIHTLSLPYAAKRLVVGAWHDQPIMIVCYDANQGCQLMSLNEVLNEQAT